MIRRRSTNGNHGRLRIRCKGGNKEDAGDISAGEKKPEVPAGPEKNGDFLVFNLKPLSMSTVLIFTAILVITPTTATINMIFQLSFEAK